MRLSFLLFPLFLFLIYKPYSFPLLRKTNGEKMKMCQTIFYYTSINNSPSIIIFQNNFVLSFLKILLSFKILMNLKICNFVFLTFTKIAFFQNFQFSYYSLFSNSWKQIFAYYQLNIYCGLTINQTKELFQ